MRRPQTIPVPFGSGVDRATGGLAVSGRSMEVARNLILREAKYQVRAGIGDPIADLGTITSAGPTNQFSDVVCHVAHYRAAGILVWIGYERSSGKVRIYSSDLLGGAMAYVALMGTLGTYLDTPPIFRTAESTGILLIAHDEPDVSARLVTYKWDKLAPASPAALQANLDGGGAADVKFRGVVEYRDWIFSWGYGSASDPARAEIVRVCMPGDPTSWKAEHYFLVGTRDDPVLTCEPGSNVLVVFKSGEWHRILGTDRSNWQVELGDTKYGVDFSRGAIGVNGVIYHWSSEGPRITNGLEPSRDLAAKLDIDAPPMLPSAINANRVLGWTAYVPRTKELWWGFPGDTQTGVLAFSLRDAEPGPDRWATHLLGVPILCAGTKTNAPALDQPDPGTIASISSEMIIGYHPTDPWAASPAVANELNLTWTLASVVGDETIEFWVKVDSGSYSKVTEQPISGSSGGSKRFVDLAGVLWTSTSVDVALRLRRRGGYATGYTSTNPADWPSAAKHSVSPFWCNQVTSLTWDSVKPNPFFQDTASPVGKYAFPYWELKYTVGKASYTKPSTVSTVNVVLNVPWSGNVARGLTHASTLPNQTRVDYTLTSGNHTDTSFQVTAAQFYLPNSYIGYAPHAHNGVFDGASVALRFVHTSALTGASVTYYGKGSSRVSLGLYATRTTSFSSTPAADSVPGINTADYSWNVGLGTIQQVAADRDAGSGVAYTNAAVASNTPGVGSTATYIRSNLGLFVADDSSVSYGAEWDYWDWMPYSWIATDGAFTGIKSESSTVRVRLACRNQYAYQWAWGEGWTVNQPCVYYGPWLELGWFDTGVAASVNENPYTPWDN